MNYNKSVWVDVFSEKDFRRYRKGRIVAKLINIGFGNVVNSDKIIAVVSPEAAPVKRMVQRAKESNRIIDAKTHESSAHHRRRIYHPFGFAAGNDQPQIQRRLGNRKRARGI